MLKQSKWGILASFVAALAMTGCGSGDDHPDTANASGSVTYQGVPMPGALVTFSPLDEGGSPAFGTTNNQGQFTLSTFGFDDGAVPGNYKVTVSKMQGTAQGDEGSTEEDPGAAYLAMEAQGVDVIGGTGDGEVGAGAAESQDLLPIKYKSKDTTPFTEEVPADGKDDYMFALE